MSEVLPSVDTEGVDAELSYLQALRGCFGSEPFSKDELCRLVCKMPNDVASSSVVRDYLFGFESIKPLVDGKVLSQLDPLGQVFYLALLLRGFNWNLELQKANEVVSKIYYAKSNVGRISSILRKNFESIIAKFSKEDNTTAIIKIIRSFLANNDYGKLMENVLHMAKPALFLGKNGFKLSHIEKAANTGRFNSNSFVAQCDSSLELKEDFVYIIDSVPNLPKLPEGSNVPSERWKHLLEIDVNLDKFGMALFYCWDSVMNTGAKIDGEPFTATLLTSRYPADETGYEPLIYGQFSEFTNYRGHGFMYLDAIDEESSDRIQFGVRRSVAAVLR